MFDRECFKAWLSHFDAKATSLTLQKNRDYSPGDDAFANFRAQGELGFVTRMQDKMTRIQNLCKRQQINEILAQHGIEAELDGVPSESIDDSLIDLYNYCRLHAGFRAEKNCWSPPSSGVNLTTSDCASVSIGPVRPDLFDYSKCAPQDRAAAEGQSGTQTYAEEQLAYMKSMDEMIQQGIDDARANGMCEVCTVRESTRSNYHALICESRACEDESTPPCNHDTDENPFCRAWAPNFFRCNWIDSGHDRDGGE